MAFAECTIECYLASTSMRLMWHQNLELNATAKSLIFLSVQMSESQKPKNDKRGKKENSPMLIRVQK